SGIACFTASSIASSRQLIERIGRRHKLAATVGATFQLNFTLRKPLRPDQYLPRNADQVSGGKFRTRPLIGIVVEKLNALGRQLAIEGLRRGVGFSVALLEIKDRNPERRNGLRPYDPGVVMESFNDGGDEARWADAIGAHVDRMLAAIRTGNDRPHGCG